MFPMITEVSEFDRAKALVDRERQHLERHGHAVPETILLGAMVEVPSLLWQLEELVARVDFLSVGSNDLLQFLFAIDRANSQLADRFDPLSPGPMRAFRRIVEAADAGNVPVTLCGELAGDPLSAIALLGIGYRSISMAPAAVGPVKAMVLSLDLAALEDWLLSELDKPHTSLRKELTAFARGQNVQI
jgi:phosphotransferase system, enzyme I, PtsP